MKPIKFTTEAVVIETYDSNIMAAIQKMLDKCRAESLEDAFYVCDLGNILRKFERWQRLLPRVAPHYAVKCNDDTVVLETLASVGMGFDCASKAEIKKVLDCGVSASKIIYANPCKQSNHIKFAANNRVSIMTFDNLDELEKIKVIFPEAQLVLRILPAEFKAVCNLGVKFGATQGDVPRLLERARELKLNIVGVSFHVGSGCQDADAFPAAVQLARDAFDLAMDYGFKPYLLDIGGGFPGDDLADVSFEEICAVLSPALDHLFPASSGVEIIAEPGRYFVASAYTLAVNVIAKRRVSPLPEDEQDVDENDEDAPKFMYYVNDGVYGSFNCLLYDHAVVYPIVPGVSESEAVHVSSIWGPTCDGLDCISARTSLPELEIGDWIVFQNMGAYTLAAGCQFNGMPMPRGNYVIGNGEISMLDNESCSFLHKLLIPSRPSLLELTDGPDYNPAYKEYFIKY